MPRLRSGCDALMTGSPSSQSSPPEHEKAEVSAPAQWEGLRDAPAVRSDGIRASHAATGAPAVHGHAVRAHRRSVPQALPLGGRRDLLMTFVSQHVLVSGYLVTDEAMEPTLRPGDRVFANDPDHPLDVVVQRAIWGQPEEGQGLLHGIGLASVISGHR
jgi:hypothetical protein